MTVNEFLENNSGVIMPDSTPVTKKPKNLPKAAVNVDWRDHEVVHPVKN